MKNSKELEKRLKLSFKKRELLETALTHRSYLNENPSIREHNERLEFLGDAVIELVVTEYLFAKFPTQSEGKLTNLRAALVRRETLSSAAEQFQLLAYLNLSHGERSNLTKSKHSILANSFEALVGAIYLDSGIVKTKSFLKRALLPLLETIIEKEGYVDPKSRFQEIAQAKHTITPTYRVLQAVGPDHNKRFTIGVYLDKKFVASGSGPSKQEAEQAAAKEALKEKNW